MISTTTSTRDAGGLDADQLASVAIAAMGAARVAYRAGDVTEVVINLRLARYASVRLAWELAARRGLS